MEELPIKSDLRNVCERLFYQISVILVGDCQVLLEIENRTCLSATANVSVKSIVLMAYDMQTGT